MTIAAVTGRDDWRVAVVLGSGLSKVAAGLVGGDPISYERISQLPGTRVAGHEGALYAGAVDGVPVLVFAGRAHLYEGHDARAVTAWVRLACEAGCDTVVVTNAAGAVAPHLEVGAPCLISDHLNLTGANPLVGEPAFVDLSGAYDPALRAAARAVDPALGEGVYAGLRGPSYETPAEVRMLAALGADLVGMSTVLEVIAARSLSARVLGISIVTNVAGGLAGRPLDHREVAAAGRAAAGRLQSLLAGVIGGL